MTATLFDLPSGATDLDVLVILDRLTSDPGTGSEVALIVEGVVEVAKAPPLTEAQVRAVAAVLNQGRTRSAS